jgi:hypothetical protein
MGLSDECAEAGNTVRPSGVSNRNPGLEHDFALRGPRLRRIVARRLSAFSRKFPFETRLHLDELGPLSENLAGRIVLPVVTRGRIEPSAMRKASTP